jgi:hypothetical protein
MSSAAVIEKRLFSLADSSTYLGGISVFSLRRYIDAGLIEPTRICGRVFIGIDELRRIERDGIGRPRTRRNGGQ